MCTAYETIDNETIQVLRKDYSTAVSKLVEGVFTCTALTASSKRGVKHACVRIRTRLRCSTVRREWQNISKATEYNVRQTKVLNLAVLVQISSQAKQKKGIYNSIPLSCFTLCN